MSEPGPAVEDRLLGGRLRLVQARGGHRAGTDAVLLAAAADLREVESFVDVGAGSGAAGLMLALRRGSARGILLEADPGSADLARRNCILNGVEARVSVAVADVFAAPACRAAGLGPEAAALVVTNPPFYRAGEVRASPDAGRAAAHVLGSGDHGDWLRAALRFLAPRGRFLAIHRPEALPALLAAAAGRLGGLVVRTIHAREGDDASRILLAGVRGNRAPLRIAAPFVLHGSDGRVTLEAEAVHRGEGLIVM